MSVKGVACRDKSVLWAEVDQPEVSREKKSLNNFYAVFLLCVANVLFRNVSSLIIHYFNPTMVCKGSHSIQGFKNTTSVSVLVLPGKKFGPLLFSKLSQIPELCDTEQCTSHVLLKEHFTQQ